MHHRLHPADTFVRRHLGSGDAEIQDMLAALGEASVDSLIEKTVPSSIRMDRALELERLPDRELGEAELLATLKDMVSANDSVKPLIGLGYYGCLTPGVILRNIFENPGWYTQYTPYQAEISQGRLEALLNFQTMVADLTGLPVANASLLDEGTAAAEAMHMAHARKRGKKPRFFAADDCHPQTLAVLRTRAEARGIELLVGPLADVDLDDEGLCGLLLQTPNTEGVLIDCQDLIGRARERDVLVSVATDLLALTLMTPPGDLGADIAIGSAQRFGVPLGFGGPHAAFLATREEFKRQIPGRIIGVSKDSAGKEALRMAMQTREQHIRREKATSNICTAQVLLAVMAGAYAVYHGPGGLRRIAERVRLLTLTLAAGLEELGHEVDGGVRFDTLAIKPKGGVETALARAADAGYDLRHLDEERLGISLDETVTAADLVALLWAFGAEDLGEAEVLSRSESLDVELPEAFNRQSSYLDHEVFHRYHTEHEMLRYLHRLESRDLSLTTSMIALGCAP